ncbi:MAG TPA: hypothetical protein VLM05_01855, partial [Mycobacteriales bacterium]|nr:hypothetical protein [Mycobacteriales bacterium]
AGPATEQRLRDYLAAGMTELHLYHLGLLGRPGLDTLRAVLATTRTLAAGPATAGPATAGPATAGPATAGG